MAPLLWPARLVSVTPRCCCPLWVVSPCPVDLAVLSGLRNGFSMLNSLDRISWPFPSAWDYLDGATMSGQPDARGPFHIVSPLNSSG